MTTRGYLELASECLQMAQVASNSFQRTTLLDIASKWLILAGETPDAQAAMDLVEAMKRSVESYGVNS